MRAELERQRTQMERQRSEMEAKLEVLTAPQEVVSAQQVEVLGARLEALHAAQLLSDDELFAAEDSIADFIEAKASCGVVTMEFVNANRALGKAHKLVALSEGMPKDATFARQLRRKFV